MELNCEKCIKFFSKFIENQYWEKKRDSIQWAYKRYGHPFEGSR